ncbi:MAG: twin-arginine translocase TatA/TatE family subunit, partial [Chloroflexi bacterium]|nr:twin-arginine translocase TatA/TatE family subunit [Chloroflexota bacterium]
MPHLGTPELILILVIVVAVFGAGKLANLGGALGKGVRDFRTSLKDPDAKKDDEIAEATKAVSQGPVAAPAEP